MRVSERKMSLCLAKACATQGQIAEKAGMSRQTLAKIIRGHECRPDTLGRLSKALEVEPQDLVE